jgi:hypothetical protein
MPTLPNPWPKPFLGVEIHCTWTFAQFFPDAVRSWDQETYEAWPHPHQRVAAGSLKEIRALIRQALTPSA